MPSSHINPAEISGPVAGDATFYLALRSLPIWQHALVPALSAAVDTMIESGDLSVATAEALDDLGQFCQRLGAAIIDERIRRGLPMPSGPDD
ncbi:hypothetical protein [Methylobacterium brachythecii]|nr:hypothetical protein [Methylobacterium brachythecii]MBB3904773.1 hypothetical protein [Methylobacterium brachythecii]